MEHPDSARKLSANLYDMYHCCCVYSGKTPDDGQRNCPKKNVDFHFKNKFLVISASRWFYYKKVQEKWTDLC